jgi:Tol biopolymer transport system component
VRVHAQGEGHSYLPSLSRNGRYVGFGSDAALVASDDEGEPDAYVADVASGTVVRASQTAAGVGGNKKSAANAVAISGNGQTLVYQSYADNLVRGDRFDLEETFVWRAAS